MRHYVLKSVLNREPEAVVRATCNGDTAYLLAIDAKDLNAISEIGHKRPNLTFVDAQGKSAILRARATGEAAAVDAVKTVALRYIHDENLTSRRARCPT